MVDQKNGSVSGPEEDTTLVAVQKPALETKESAEKITHTRTFKLYLDQEKTVEQALELAKERVKQYDSVAIGISA